MSNYTYFFRLELDYYEKTVFRKCGLFIWSDTPDDGRNMSFSPTSSERNKLIFEKINEDAKHNFLKQADSKLHYEDEGFYVDVIDFYQV